MIYASRWLAGQQAAIGVVAIVMLLFRLVVGGKAGIHLRGYVVAGGLASICIRIRIPVYTMYVYTHTQYYVHALTRSKCSFLACGL